MSKNERQLFSLASSAGNDISCSVYSSFEEIKDMQQEWDDFVESVDGDIYLTYDWCHVWWQFYGKGRVLRIFIYKQNEQIIGLVPVFYEKVWLGPVWLKLGKIVGSDFTMAMINPPVNSNFTRIIFDIFNFLVKKEDCDAIYWGPLSEKCLAVPTIDDNLIRYNNDYRLFHRRKIGNYTVFSLPDTFESYVSSLSKSTRKHYNRSHRNLRNDYKVEFRQAENVVSSFAEFVKMHRAQWVRVNKLGHFDDWPAGKAFHEDMIKAQAQQDRLRLFCMTADGEPVAYRYIYCFGGRYHSFLPARKCGEKWDKYGLGQLAHMLTVEKAITEGVSEIDAGRGYYEHKLKLGGQEFSFFSYLIYKNTFGSIVRVYLFTLLSHILNFLYYRVWFNRLASKLPFKRRPLWKLWIRTRL